MIEFESVGKTFRDGTAAVVDLSLQVPSDKITVIVGPSGCGKTTTLRMVNRMIEPSTGRITWDGSPLRSKRKTTLRRQMGYVIQSAGLFPHRTVVENIGTVPGLLGWSKAKTQQRSLELLDSVGLDRKLADRYPVQLSGGQQQRVGVARALAADPLVMLMDEPFSAVDPVVRAELHEFFLGLQREISKTIILITHDIDEAIKLGDQVAILRVGGHLAQVGTPQQVLDEPADAFVEGFVGRDRGYRSLSFQPASALDLDSVPVVREVTAARGPGPTLVVDGEARPLGWVDARQEGRTVALGATFDVDASTLRNALDAVLTSPVGLAVGVHGSSGRYAGVVTTETVLAAMKRAKAGRPQESVTLAASEPAPQDDTTRDDSTQHDTTQHDTTQHDTTQHHTGPDGGAVAGERAGDETVVRPAGAHGLAAAGAGDGPEEAHTVSAELGDESGQDVDPAALTPDERGPGAAGGADLLGHESALSTQESRAGATVDSDDADARR